MVSYPASERRGGRRAAGRRLLKLGRIFSASMRRIRFRCSRGLVWYLPVSGPPINGKTFPGRFQRVPGEKQTLAAHRFPNGNAPFRFRAVALFSRGGSKLPLYFGKPNRVYHVGLRDLLELFLSVYR